MSERLFHHHKQQQHCPQCGMTFDDFNRNGRFGCDECYTAFASEIAPLVKRLQGSLNYEGRVPGRGNGVFRTKHQIKRLRQDLQKAVLMKDQVLSLPVFRLMPALR